MKENKNLGCAEQTATFDMAADRLLSVTANGVEAASADHFVAAVGDATERLRSIAWGIPLRQTADTHWGTVGNWSLWEEYRRHVGRYLVTPDGEARKLNPSHSGYYLDGSAVDESEGNVMVIAPKLHVRVIDDPLLGCPVVWMSQQPLGGFALANAGGEWNCYAAYKGAMDGTRLVSRSGVARAYGMSIQGFWAAAQANGSDWGLFDYDGWRWYCLMCLCESEGWTNIQDALGYGPYGDGPANQTMPEEQRAKSICGCTKALGDETATIPIADSFDKACNVSVCGVENLYGFATEVIQGIYGAQGSPKTAYIYKGNRVPASVTEANNPPSGDYRTLIVPASVVTGIHNYSRYMLGAWFDLMPMEVGGSTSAGFCDMGQFNSNGQVTLVGAASSAFATAASGPFSVWMVYNIIGNVGASRLGYYGHLTFA